MDRLQRLLATASFAIVYLWAGVLNGIGQSSDPVQAILRTAQQAVLERKNRTAIRELKSGLEEFPRDNRLRLELGHAYMSDGADRRAADIFLQILRSEPNNRAAKLELAFAFGYMTQYEASNKIYQDLLGSDPADEAPAIGLASNLLHQRHIREAEAVVEQSLTIHPNSIRLQELKDRIAIGQFGGDEREPKSRSNLFEATSDYFNDSLGNHSWRTTQRFDFALTEGMGNRVLFDQQFQHSRDDKSEEVTTFIEQLRWRPRGALLVYAGGGAVRFNNGDVNGVYESTVALQPLRTLFLSGKFERIPITPNAEATEHRLTAQGWEAYTAWTPGPWKIESRLSRYHYTDRNIGSRESGELKREWKSPRVSYSTGYRYSHQGFTRELAHGYFTPDNYQSHLAAFGLITRLTRWHRGEVLVRVGAESIASGLNYNPAWEIEVRNQVLLKSWALELNYSKFHLTQDTGAFRADAGQFAMAYHF